MVRTVLYFLWWGFPLLFIFLALWAKLEQFSHKGVKATENAKPYLRQALFLFVCAAATTLIDIYFLETEIKPLLPAFIPFELSQIALFPFVLWIGALITGGTKPIKIEKISHVSKKKQ